MTSLWRFSTISMWSSLKVLKRTVPVSQNFLHLFKESPQLILSSSYCKRYGLYDNEEDTYGEYNRRGAYKEQRKFETDPNLNRRYSGLNDNEDDTYEEHRVKGGYRDQINTRYGGSYNADFAPRNSFRRGTDSYGRDNRFDPSFQRGRDSSFGGFRKGYGGSQYQFRDSYMENSNLEDEKFDLSRMPNIQKNLYAEHADVAARPMDEVESFYKTHNISIKGNNIPKPITKFSELNIPEPLYQVVNDENFENPTPIQSLGWPIAMSGRDMIGISQTGSGKTLVFAVPAMIHIMNQPRPEYSPRYANQPQALILAPTRELAQQIYTVTSKFQYSCGIRSSCVYGGASKGVQLSRMRDTQLCIATPGRLIDFLTEGSISLRNCTYLVLDEADRMLDMGFEPQIRRIVGQVRPDRQTLMWSATWPQEVRRLAEDFLIDYVHVTIGSDELAANPNIEQNVHVLHEHEKFDRLISLLQNSEGKKLIFAQTKRMVDLLANKLNQRGVRAMGIHGDVSQAGRDRALHSFRNIQNSLLIATDVAARGLDVNDIQHVINYDFPPNVEDYIHRIGRTARGLKTGVAHSFFTEENVGQARDLIAVLTKSKQTVNPELMTFVGRGGSKGNRRFQGRNDYYGRSFA